MRVTVAQPFSFDVEKLCWRAARPASAVYREECEARERAKLAAAYSVAMCELCALGDHRNCVDAVRLGYVIFGCLPCDCACTRRDAAVQRHRARFRPSPPKGDVASTGEIVRVLRVVEYIGPREAVEATVRKSIHGTKELSSGLRIVAATLTEYPEILKSST